MPAPRLFLLACAIPALCLAAAAGGCLPAGRQAPSSPAPASSRAALTPQHTGTDALFIAVSAATEEVVWLAGTGGRFARTTDGGRAWEVGVVPGADTLQFRDVHAVDARTAYLLSIGPGAASRIYKTTDGGARWTLQFTNGEPAAFFDCFAFWDADHGLAFSDAVDGRFPILSTSDGGAHWTPLPPPSLPPARPGEGSFAASGTCLTTVGREGAWIGTGNAERPRALVTTDRGTSWRAIDLPLPGGEATGVASIVFASPSVGAALGGNVADAAAAGPRVAVTRDGGARWTAVEGPPFPGAVYGAAFVPGSSPERLVAVGPGGAAYTDDLGMSWTVLDTLTYWGIDFEGPRAGWLAGPDGRVTRVRFE